MSRYSHSHHNNHHSQSTVHRGRPVSSHEEALASNSFEHFLTASTLKTIFGTYRNICEHLHLKPNCIPHFYPKLKAHVNSWKAKPLWKKFDGRVNQKCYNRGKACPNTRVLIIGAGPCGLRTAIEAQLLGAKVVVVEKRDRMTRNNVLHLWPFVIDDLRGLGAKKFFGKFCAGSIDHISIRQLQCVLLKVALLLGVEIHTEVSFERLIEPNPSEKTGWRAEFKPSNHPVSQFEFDVIIGADGKRNTLQGFKRKEFRGKLAIAITANFINKRTEAEARVEEISGVAFIFNQKFFKDLYIDTGIDLENIVYYKDDTHYFVMTAKKQSLIDKGVIRQDLSDTAKLLAAENVNRDELMNYAREAADFSTNYQMPDLEFAVNHYGQPDVAMFDFTSMYAAENASRIIERSGYRLLSILVGDSLLEPFWPTGSGCARGFLSSMDAAWAIRSWETATPLQVIAERESIYRLLAQTTPENLNKDYKSYTLDPTTRYPNLNKNVLLPHQVTNLFDSDNTKNVEVRHAPLAVEVPKKRRRRESHVDPDTLQAWIQDQVREYESLNVANITTSFTDGKILCAIIHHYRPDLLDYGALNPNEVAKNNQIAFDVLEKELGIPPVMTGAEMAQTDCPDYLTQLSYLTQIYDTFRCEIPHIKHPKLEPRFSVPRKQTRFIVFDSIPIRPALLTPKSSAKLSEEDTRVWSSHRGLSNASSAPSLNVTPKQPEINNEVLVKTSKSVNLSPERRKEEDKQEVANVPDKIEKVLDDTKQHKFDEVKEKFHMSNLKIQLDNNVKSEVLPPTGDRIVITSKSQNSQLEKEITIDSWDGFRPAKSILPGRKHRKRCLKCNDKSTSKCSSQTSHPKHKQGSDGLFDVSGDEVSKMKISRALLKPTLKTSIKSIGKRRSMRISTTTLDSKKISKENSLKQHSFIKPSKENTTPNTMKFTKPTVFKDAVGGDTTDEVYRYQSNLTPLVIKPETTGVIGPQDCLQKTPSSMEGSSEVALKFLKEMDQFLADQDVAYEKINDMKNNLKVQILRPKRSIFNKTPPEIPEVLLETRDSNRHDKQSDVIIIQNERRNKGTISVEEVKVFSIANCIKVVPRLISSVTDHLNRFRGKPNQVSVDDTTYHTTKCQVSRSQSLGKNKLSSCNKMSYKPDKSEGSTYRVENWLVSSNFEDIYEDHQKPVNLLRGSDCNDTMITTDPEMEVQYSRNYCPIRHNDLRHAHEMRGHPHEFKDYPRERRDCPHDVRDNPRNMRGHLHDLRNAPCEMRSLYDARDNLPDMRDYEHQTRKQYDLHDMREQPLEVRNPYDPHDMREYPREVIEEEAKMMDPKMVTTKNSSYDSMESVSKFMEIMKTNNVSGAKLSNVSPWEIYEGRMRDKSETDKFHTIVEAEETDLPEPKRLESDIKELPTPNMYMADTEHVSRASSRHKRQTPDASFASKTMISQGDRKMRKRKTAEKIGASVLCTAFVIVMWETGLLAFVLFLLDLVCNIDKYELASLIFS